MGSFRSKSRPLRTEMLRDFGGFNNMQGQIFSSSFLSSFLGKWSSSGQGGNVIHISLEREERKWGTYRSLTAAHPPPILKLRWWPPCKGQGWDCPSCHTNFQEMPRCPPKGVFLRLKTTLQITIENPGTAALKYKTITWNDPHFHFWIYFLHK